MAVTAAVTPIRIVCANTLGAALRQAEHGVAAQRTFRFRHMGDLQAKFTEARQVLGMTINYQKQFKELADRMAAEPIAEWAFERRVLRHLWTIDEDMGKVARANRERTIEMVLAVFRGRGADGDTTGNSPGNEVDRVQRARGAPRLRPPVHEPHQSGPALVRGHRAEATRAGSRASCLTNLALRPR